MRPIRSLKHVESVTLSCRVAKDDAEIIKEAIKISGMTQQDYIRDCLMKHEIKVVPNIRVRHYIEQYLLEIKEELRRTKVCSTKLEKRLENVLKVIEQM